MSMFREAPTGDAKGPVSVRRVCAFFFGGTIGSVAGVAAVLLRADWKVVAASFGIPYALLLGLLICTTAEDIKTVISAAKGV